MLLVLENLLDAPALAALRTALLHTAPTDWQDGRATAGYAAAALKRNQQLPAQHPQAVAQGRRVLDALAGNARFVSFALPQRVLTPMFNRHADGGEYGFHIDNALRIDPLSGQRLRADVSTTVFLSDPADYDGGELIVQDTYGEQCLKLPAGHAVVYPASSLHRVAPVTRGERLAAVLWTQSMVADDSRRALLHDLDGSIQRLAARADNAAEVTRLTGTYHNLLRQWAQV